MHINSSGYTIAELADRYSRKEIVINRDYQRAGGVWPNTAKVYFIDTILEKFPFPKIYLYQKYDRAKKKPVMEVVDGQQRLLTIIEFLKDGFKLSNASKNYSGLLYSDLPEEVQEGFAMYSVQADVILAAERPELLEMFRRMNAYTASLNDAEKRHSKFQGEFKWFVIEVSDKISPTLEEYEILSTKQLIRMADAELVSDLVIALDVGIKNKTKTEIDKIYKKYDEKYENRARYQEIILEFFNLLVDHFSALRGTYLMKPYAVYSFFVAFAHLKYGIPGGEEALGVPCRRKNVRIDAETIEKLQEVADAHEVKDVAGEYGVYVRAAMDTTTKVQQRTDRTSVITHILDPK